MLDTAVLLLVLLEAAALPVGLHIVGVRTLRCKLLVLEDWWAQDGVLAVD